MGNPTNPSNKSSSSNQPIFENGIREAIMNLKKDVDDLSDRIHFVEIKGCPLGQSTKEQVTDLKRELRELKIVVYKTSGALALLFVLIQVGLKFI